MVGEEVMMLGVELERPQCGSNKEREAAKFPLLLNGSLMVLEGEKSRSNLERATTQPRTWKMIFTTQHLHFKFSSVVLILE